MKNKIMLFVSLFVTIITLTGCSSQKNLKLVNGEVERSSIEMDGIEEIEKLPGNDFHDKRCEVKGFSSIKEMLLNLESERIDALTMGKSTADYIQDSNDSYVSIEIGGKTSFHMATRKDNKDLASKITSAIDQIKEDGTMTKLEEKYIQSYENIKDIKFDKVEGPVYKVGITGDFPPFDYVSDAGVPSGFNVALMNEIGKRLNCNFEFVQINAKVRLIALESKKIDVIFVNNFPVLDNYIPSSTQVNLTPAYVEEDVVALTLKKNEDRIRNFYEELMTVNKKLSKKKN